jgi:DNA-binding NarL/FixJ family response regulator
MIRIAIVEDDEKIRESLIALLESSDGFRCVAAYETAEEAIEDFHHKDADVVLMDIHLPGMSGTEGVRKLKEIKPALEVIMLTVYEETEKIFSSLEAGASGYLLKQTPPSELLSGIRQVMDGGSPMSPQIARRVVQSFKKETVFAPRLSDRERQILDLLVKGKRYKEIADLLFISPATVHTHLHNIYEKLQVRSRAEATIKYLRT